MQDLPFSKYTLKFSNQQFQNQYEQFVKLKAFHDYRIIILLLIIALLVKIGDYLGKGDHVITLYTVQILLLVLIGAYTKFYRQNTQLVMFLFLVQYLVVAKFIIALENCLALQIDNLIKICLLFMSNYKQKIIYLVLHIILNFVQNDGFEVQNLAQFCSSLFLNVILMIILYRLEHQQIKEYCRDHQITQKLSFLNQIISACLMIVHFNKRTNQFELIKSNQSAIDELAIRQPQNRLCGLQKLGSRLNLQIMNYRQNNNFAIFFKNLKSMKEQNLEECIHHYQQNEELISALQEYKSFVPLRSFKKVPVDIKIQMFDRELRYLAIVLDDEKSNSRLQTVNLHTEYLSRVFKQYLDHSVASTIKTFNFIDQLVIQFNKKSKKITTNLNTLYCFNLLCLNSYYNYIALVNYGEMDYNQGQIKSVNIQRYFLNLNKFFKHIAKKSNKVYLQKIYTGALQIMKINEKETTQLIINLVSNAIQYAQKGSTIELIICLQKIERKQEMGLVSPRSPNLPEGFPISGKASQGRFEDCESLLDGSKKKSRFGPIQSDIQSLRLNKLELEQFILKLDVKNIGPLLTIEIEKEILLNPQNHEDFYHNNHSPIHLGIPVSRALLKRLGPYDKIFVKSQNEAKSVNLFVPNNYEIQRRSSFQNPLPSIRELGQSQHSQQSSCLRADSGIRGETIVTFYIHVDQAEHNDQSYFGAVKNRRRSLFV